MPVYSVQAAAHSRWSPIRPRSTGRSHRDPVVLVIYVTMVYGPIAALLVEMFPTRIRYTGMSCPTISATAGSVACCRRPSSR